MIEARGRCDESDERLEVMVDRRVDCMRVNVTGHPRPTRVEKRFVATKVEVEEDEMNGVRLLEACFEKMDCL